MVIGGGFLQDFSYTQTVLFNVSCGGLIRLVSWTLRMRPRSIAAQLRATLNSMATMSRAIVSASAYEIPEIALRASSCTARKFDHTPDGTFSIAFNV